MGAIEMQIEQHQKNLPVGWKLLCSKKVDSRSPSYFGIDDLPVRDELKKYIKLIFGRGIYKHQRLALERGIKGENVCLTTGTASGKTLAFQLLGLEKILSHPNGVVLAIYPLKALGAQQEKRWKKFFKDAGVDKTVCRVDGSVPSGSRKILLKKASVLICTPDILHAWMLSSLADPDVRNFLTRLKLIVIDEIHSYTGVFGSNSGFLFRRLQHVMDILGSKPQFIGASATIANPEEHLMSLVGKEFYLITESNDTSPRHSIIIDIVSQDSQKDSLSSVSELIQYISEKNNNRFIVFVDSRKQVEHFASISARNVQEKVGVEGLEYLDKLEVLPYRAGYESEDRKNIQDRLQEGKLRGVVSTSALELGLDIPNLNVCILVGVPRSSTSLWQRIGRVGRSEVGHAYVINNDDMLNGFFKENPGAILDRPLAEGSLYLQNPRIQYIHALCLARSGGEHDLINGFDENSEEIVFSSVCTWPEGFKELCAKERIGEISAELQSMKAEAGEDPNHVFPLRNVESQFLIQYKQGPDQRSLGTISHSQLLRECYPGAIYYYLTKPFRVCRVLMNTKQVLVRKEKSYTTRPQTLPTLVFPNFSVDSDINFVQQGDTKIVECPLQIRQSIAGFYERRGPNKFKVTYGENLDGSIQFNQPRFSRHTFTSGVLLSHPNLKMDGLDRALLAELFFEAFLTIVPFERRDLGASSDIFRKKWESISEGERFLALYDDTYGSLKLSSKLMEPGTIKSTVGKAINLYPGNYEEKDKKNNIIKTLMEIYEDLGKSPVNRLLRPHASSKTEEGSEDLKLVIKPGSKGIDLFRNNEVFYVESVFFSPRLQKLAYRGKLDDDDKNYVGKNIIPVENIEIIYGVSELGYYDMETGQIEEIESKGGAEN